MKSKKVDLKVKFSNAKKPEWVAIHLLWADYQEDLQAYIKKKNLQGGY